MIVEKIREQVIKSDFDCLFVAGLENPMALMNIRYLSSFSGTAGYVLIGKDFGYFISDFRYRDQAQEQVLDLEFIELESSIATTINELIAKHEVKKIGFDKTMYYFQYEFFAKNISAELVPASGVIEDSRISKTEKEIELLQKACDITDKVFEHIVDFIKPGLTEKEVERELKDQMLKLGAESTWPSFIVASGERGAMPHGTASDKVIEEGEMVTLDFGCNYKGYTSDITRTIAVGDPDPKLVDIYKIVYDAQIAAVKEARAGMTGKELDAVCRDIITDAGYGEYFKHGTGHGLGLNVHEAPSVSPKYEKKLPLDSVVTIEPGIYITGLGGVRIEDDVVLKEDGCIVLTNSPKELIIIK